jgi:hypothetical protein
MPLNFGIGPFGHIYCSAGDLRSQPGHTSVTRIDEVLGQPAETNASADLVRVDSFLRTAALDHLRKEPGLTFEATFGHELLRHQHMAGCTRTFTDYTSAHEWIFDIDPSDYHSHSMVGGDLNRATFEDLITESDWLAPAWTTFFDTQLRFALHRRCAPVVRVGSRQRAALRTARRTHA